MRIASILLQEAFARGLGPDDDLSQQLEHDPLVGKRQLFTTQPRQQKLRPAISEFGYSMHLALTVSDAPTNFLDMLCPKGSRIVARHVQRGFNRDVFMAMNNAKLVNEIKEGDVYELVKVGVPREPPQFITAAVALGHPRFLLARVNNDSLAAVNCLLGDAADLSLRRTKFLKRLLQRANELRDQEAELHESLPVHLKKVLKGKRILLWKEVLVQLGYPDAKVMDEVVKGFPMTGWAEQSGVFMPDVRPPEMNVEQLKGMALGLNHAVVGAIKNSEPSELDAPAWDETQLEVQQGWLQPCDVDDLGVVHIAKRFPIQQGGKLRLIDDFTVAGVNQTVGLGEKLRVESVDELAANVLVALTKAPPSHGLALVGRTFDLKSAYKQFGVDVEHQRTLRIAQRHPEGGVRFFSVQSLPFGATASVSSFLRIAASIKFIGTAGLSLVWTNFFDDYTAICTPETTREVTFCVEALLKLLGVQFAATGPKAPDFATKFKSLGLELDLTSSQEGSFSLGHTEKRCAELLETIQHILGKDRVDVKELERLHGRLVWFGSYVFGRELNGAVRVVFRFARVKAKSTPVSEDLVTALNFLRRELTRAEPVRISTDQSTTWFVFTDGAYEPSSSTPGTIGGLLVDQWGQSKEFFGMALPDPLMKQFLEFSLHPIYELELLPVLVAIRTWAKILLHTHVVFYLDNTAAHSALVRADGGTSLAASIVKEFVSYEKKLRLLPWFGRVPSISNPADAASRLEFDTPWLQGANHLQLVLPDHMSQWGVSTGSPEANCRSSMPKQNDLSVDYG